MEIRPYALCLKEYLYKNAYGLFLLLKMIENLHSTQKILK